MSSLADFMQELQSQEIVFSEVPKTSVHIIPPNNESTKIILPTNDEPTPTPHNKELKLKFKPKNVSVQPIEVNSTTTQVVQSSTVVENSVPTVQPTEAQQPIVTQQTTVIEPPKVEDKPVMDDVELLFIKSGTEISKKELWMEIYQKALRSRKDNEIVRRVRIGRFTLTPENQTLLLPDYDITKDPDSIIRDKWF